MIAIIFGKEIDVVEHEAVECRSPLGFDKADVEQHGAVKRHVVSLLGSTKENNC